jgi:hypothetical protein
VTEGWWILSFLGVGLFLGALSLFPALFILHALNNENLPRSSKRNIWLLIVFTGLLSGGCIYGGFSNGPHDPMYGNGDNSDDCGIFCSSDSQNDDFSPFWNGREVQNSPDDEWGDGR